MLQFCALMNTADDIQVFLQVSNAKYKFFVSREICQCISFLLSFSSVHTLSKLFWIEVIPKKVLLKKKSLLMMIYYILLISPYCRYYLRTEGCTEMKRESSKRRKYILSFRIFNNGVCSLLFRTKQRF